MELLMDFAQVTAYGHREALRPNLGAEKDWPAEG
jgi:hypothetical protein